MTQNITDPVAKENHLTDCPGCGDTMSAFHSNKVPTWSDWHDAVVCHWCATHADCEECGQEMTFDLTTGRCPDCHTCECGEPFSDDVIRHGRGWLKCDACGRDDEPEVAR